MEQTFRSAAIAARLLRYHLVRFREQAGVSQVQAAQRIDRKQPTIASMETGKSLPTQSNVEVLLTFYRVPEAFPMLRDLLGVAKLRPDPEAVVSLTVIRDFSLAVGLEPYARTIETFEPTLVCGLLQTEAYARTLMGYASIGPDVNVDAEVAVRMRRQISIDRDENPVQLWFFAEETVFRRLIGGPVVMADQLDHLIRMSERSNINIRVVPESVAVHPALLGAFCLFGFDGWWVAFEETQRNTYYYDDAESIDVYRRCVDRLRSVAWDPNRTRDFLHRRMRELASR